MEGTFEQGTKRRSFLGLRVDCAAMWGDSREISISTKTPRREKSGLAWGPKQGLHQWNLLSTKDKADQETSGEAEGSPRPSNGGSYLLRSIVWILRAI